MPTKKSATSTSAVTASRHHAEAYSSGSESGSEDDEMYVNQVAVGTETNYSSNMEETLNNAANNNQDFVCIPLFHPRFRTDSYFVSDKRQGALARSDMALDDQDWTSNVIGKFSHWIDLESSDNRVRSSSEIALKREYLYGTHLSLQAMILDAPQLVSPNYSRSVLSLLKSTPPTAAQIWIRIPLEIPITHSSEGNSGDGFYDGWQIWDNLRHSIGHQPRIHIVLEVSHDLEHFPVESMNRWAAEPVKAVALATKCFGINKLGTKPTLFAKHKAILHSLFRFNIHVIIRGQPTYSQLKLKSYIKYVEKLCAMGPDGQGQGPFTLYDKFAFPFRDNLQCPLHPLSDNLDSETYRVMEKDPVKYSQYELAVKRALIDLHSASQNDSKVSKKRKNGSNSTTPPSSPIVVMVVGAGRGPLVQATLNASEETGIEVKIYAVEKNFNAVVTLRNRFFEPIVTVLSTDMRDLPTLVSRLGITLEVDIIVSELLGSWGDNELSPECLDTVQHYLKPGSGVMIPQNYESYVSPMTCSKLWMSAKDMFHHSDVKSGLDTPYVVNFHSVYVPLEAKPLFKFFHPNPEIGEMMDHNKRYSSASFVMEESMTIHGFAGYFDCVLYKDVTFSTVPHTHSPGMFSWFPLYVPIRNPFRVNPGDHVTVNVWRCGDNEKVWYEWGLSQPLSTSIQNSNGLSYYVKL